MKSETPTDIRSLDKNGYTQASEESSGGEISCLCNVANL